MHGNCCCRRYSWEKEADAWKNKYEHLKDKCWNIKEKYDRLRICTDQVKVEIECLRNAEKYSDMAYRLNYFANKLSNALKDDQE